MRATTAMLTAGAVLAGVVALARCSGPGAPADAVRGAEGRFTSAAGEQQTFLVAGQHQVWDRWDFTTPEGTSGSFTLGGDFRGGGLITRGDRTVGALNWPATGDGYLSLLDTGTSAISPSSAARDFQIDRWVSSIAALGPAPFY